MQAKLSDNTCIVQGTCTKGAETFIRGEKNIHITQFSLAVGKRKDTTTIFVNCKAFGRLADRISGIQKGDSVLCIGRVESREYNGKTYSDLICDWVGVSGTGVSQDASSHTTSFPAVQDNPMNSAHEQQMEIRDYDPDADNDLPF